MKDLFPSRFSYKRIYYLLHFLLYSPLYHLFILYLLDRVLILTGLKSRGFGSVTIYPADPDPFHTDLHENFKTNVSMKWMYQPGFWWYNYKLKLCNRTRKHFYVILRLRIPYLDTEQCSLYTTQLLLFRRFFKVDANIFDKLFCFYILLSNCMT